ncbi:phosphate acetyltransferase, partial [bacterium]|nr:phosphate acetyltransferase [bacterium]
MSNIVEKHRERAKQLHKTIVLPEAALDTRTLKAARIFADEELGVPVIVGDPAELQKQAAEAGVSLDGIQVIDMAKYERLDEMIAVYQERRAKENLTKEQVRDLLSDPLWFGAMLVKVGGADGMTAGAVNTTANVIRASIKCIGPRKGLRTVSSAFLMVVPDEQFGEAGAMIYSDCGVIPAPTEDQLVDIGEAAAQTCRQLIGVEPEVAYLSFSTKGSA